MSAGVEPRRSPLDDGPLAGRSLAAFRFDTRRALLRSLALAIPLMCLGSAAAVVGLRLIQQREPARLFAGRATFQLAHASPATWQVLPLEQGLMVVGLLLVLLSNVLLILALRRNLATEQFILLRADGLVRQVDTHYTHVAWDDVEQVAYDAERGAIVSSCAAAASSRSRTATPGSPARRWPSSCVTCTGRPSGACCCSEGAPERRPWSA
jgi:hypothetical protein